MTDTSRSLADIKTLLADNAVGQISPQDLRDAIESIANPLPDEGFAPPAQQDRIGVFGYTDALTVPATAPSSYGDPVVRPLSTGLASYAWDPAGWGDNSYSLLGSDPTSAWGIDVVAGDCLMIPPGTIHVGMNYTTEAIVYPGDGTRLLDAYLDQATFDPAGDPPFDAHESWFYPGYYNSISVMRTPDWLSAAGTFITHLRSQVLVNDTDSEQPFAVFVIMKNQTSDLDITYFDMRIAWTPP